MPKPRDTVPVWRYTITLKDSGVKTADAIGYQDADEWMVFNDVHGTVLSILRDLVASVDRSADPVAQQGTDQL